MTFLTPCSLHDQGIDSKYAKAAFEQGKRFCDLPMEKKLEVDTARVPGEYVGYHKLQGYNRNGRKKHGWFPRTQTSQALKMSCADELQISVKPSTGYG